jgi:putative endonuclease
MKKVVFLHRNIVIIMAEHNLLGKAGEHEAVEFLVRQGLTVRETNWRMGKLEIDIIAQEPGMVLHIVEVKTRSTDEYFDPMRSITRAKKQHMVNSANAYINYYQLQCEVQYDVIILIGSPGNFKLEYYPDLFVPRLKTYR